MMSLDVPENLSHLRFRTATNDDREQVQSLVFGVLAEFDLKPDPNATDADLTDIETNYTNRGGMFDVIEDENGKLVGTYGLYYLDANTCELRKMYLVPAARGQGLGKYVLRKAVARAKEMGFKEMVLETSSKLVAAIQLYRQFGFQPIQIKHVTPRADQSYGMKL
jgi:putative acetyltransferase